MVIDFPTPRVDFFLRSSARVWSQSSWTRLHCWVLYRLSPKSRNWYDREVKPTQKMRTASFCVSNVIPGILFCSSLLRCSEESSSFTNTCPSAYISLTKIAHFPKPLRIEVVARCACCIMPYNERSTRD